MPAAVDDDDDVNDGNVEARRFQNVDCKNLSNSKSLAAMAAKFLQKLASNKNRFYDHISETLIFAIFWCLFREREEERKGGREREREKAGERLAFGAHRKNFPHII